MRDPSGRAHLANEPLHRFVVTGKAVVVDEILPDRFAVATSRNRQLDELAVWLAATSDPRLDSAFCSAAAAESGNT